MAKALQQKQQILVDAEDQIVGRLASHVAKLLLNGEHVTVVNSEKSLISGSRRNILQERLAYLEVKSVINPKHTPRHKRTPDGILKRTVRGMLPRRKPKGLAALRRLKVYVGAPQELAPAKKVVFDDTKATKPKAFYVTLGELSLRMGWKGE